MKTTRNISLGGYAFIVEEDAYGTLKSYTDAVSAGFSNELGGDEIQKDIELRMAEIFHDQLAGREVLNLEDVNKMISIMGEPSIYTDEKTANSTEPVLDDSKIERRVFRDTENRVLGGVCSGISAYFGIDPIWIRIAFLIAFFGYGSGLLVYILLFFAIPAAKTTSDKLAMRGKTPNLSNISESVKKEFQKPHVKETGNNVIQLITDLLRKIFDLTYKIFKWFLKGTALFFIILSIIGLLAIITTLLCADNFEIGPLETWSQVKEYIFVNQTYATLGYIATILLFLIPLVYIIYRVTLYILKQKVANKYISMATLLIWLGALITVIFVGFNVGLQYNKTGQSVQTYTYVTDTSKTFFLKALDADSIAEKVLDGGGLQIKNVQVDLLKGAVDSLIEIKVIRKQKGPTKNYASEQAKKIQFNHMFENGILHIPNFFLVPPKNKYRNQEIEIEITIPRGQSLIVDASLDRLLNDVELDGKIYQNDMYGYLLKMTPFGISCINCPAEIFEKVKENQEPDTTIEIEINNVESTN